MAVEDAQHLFVDLKDLDDPPSSWQKVRQREEELKNSLHLNELRALSEYHSYGFRCIKHFGLKQKYIDLLHKVLYYTQNGLAYDAAFTQSGIICAGPVGPGVLYPMIRNARQLPTWYLTEQAARAKIQPHQSLCLPRSDRNHSPGAKMKCFEIVTESPSYSESYTTSDAKSATQKGSTPATEQRGARSLSEARFTTIPRTTGEPLQPTPIIEISRDGVSDTAVPQTIERISNQELLQGVTTKKVRQAIFTTAYSGLELVPDAFLHPRAFLRATTAEALFRRLTKWNIATSHVSIRFGGNVNYSIVENGVDCCYYGRGPEWQSNSCFWDSIIVSCMFLNAGFTYLDRGSSPRHWECSLTTIQRAFLDVLRMDWDFFDTRTSVAQRDIFLNLFHREWSNENQGPKPKGKGQFDSAAARWNDIARPFHQFSFRVHKRILPCRCRNRGLRDNPGMEVQYITPPLLHTDQKGVTITDLLQRWSRYIVPHAGCEQSGAKEETHIIHGNLPIRMVLQVTGGRLLDHTSQNISFSYTRTELGSSREIIERATYRWLGGIYVSENHFRVYWNDSPPDERVVTCLRVYDGMQAHGAIIGGVPPAHKLEPIPEYWMRSCPPLLFYEQILRPDPLILEAARSAIANIADTQLDRSTFPRMSAHLTLNSADTIVTADTLLPRELSNAILKVESHSAEYHNRPSRTRLVPPTPPATPATGRLKRHTSRAAIQISSSTSSNGQKRRRNT